MNTLNTSLDISPDLWNGTLINWSPGFQIKYLINVLAFFFFSRQKLQTSFLCSLLMVSAVWKSVFSFQSIFLVGGIFHPLIKAAVSLNRGAFIPTFYFFFLLPGWHQWWLQDSLAESLWQWLTRSRKKILKWIQRENYIFRHLFIYM